MIQRPCLKRSHLFLFCDPEGGERNSISGGIFWRNTKKRLGGVYQKRKRILFDDEGFGGYL